MSEQDCPNPNCRNGKVIDIVSRPYPIEADCPVCGGKPQPADAELSERVRLTEDEMFEVMQNMPVFSRLASLEAIKRSADAQLEKAIPLVRDAVLKEVWDWGSEMCQEHGHLVTLVRECDKCWEALEEKS